MSEATLISFRQSFERLSLGLANDAHQGIKGKPERVVQEVRNVVSQVCMAIEFSSGQELLFEGDYWDFVYFAELVRQMYIEYHFHDQEKIEYWLQKADSTLKLCLDLQPNIRIA